MSRRRPQSAKPLQRAADAAVYVQFGVEVWRTGPLSSQRARSMRLERQLICDTNPEPAPTQEPTLCGSARESFCLAPRNQPIPASASSPGVCAFLETLNASRLNCHVRCQVIDIILFLFCYTRQLTAPASPASVTPTVRPHPAAHVYVMQRRQSAKVQPLCRYRYRYRRAS